MKKNYEEKYCIVRGDRSGVFAGNVENRNGREVIIKNARRLWYWDGACSISQLAKDGTKEPHRYKFTITLDEIEVLDAIEIIKCTDKAEKSIKEVWEWKK